MTALELGANAVNLISIWLASRNSVHTWWTGIVGCVLFGWFFWQLDLLADVTLQAFFVLTSAFGWWQWLHGARGGPLPVRRTSWRALAGFGSASVLVTLGYGALLFHCTSAYSPFLDSAGMTASACAQLLLMRRRVESWWLWLLANTIYVPLYLARGAHVTAAFYSAFWINAAVSLWRWRRLAVA
jgi:nicotinamide mononucleotide transporter